jgi:hypothetical protein
VWGVADRRARWGTILSTVKASEYSESKEYLSYVYVSTNKSYKVRNERKYVKITK